MTRAKARTTKPSICFVSPNNYAVLSGRTDLRHIGGAEIQQPMIGQELLRRGYSVSFVTLDHGQADGIEHDGIRVFKMCSLDDGLPIVRFVHPRWTSLNRAMSRADADFYYQMNNGAETGQVALWCRRQGRRFIFAVSSDTNCKPSLPGLPSRRERVLYRYGLRHADWVIAQTLVQQRMLRQDMGVESVLIRSCSADPYDGADTVPKRDGDGPHRLLWVGRISEEKRLELFLDTAEACTSYTFDVVGAGSQGSPYCRGLMSRMDALPNVVQHGRVPHEAIGAFYERASLVVCTSVFEGFPNTFMEAWARGVPTVTTVDPDNLVADNQVGAVVGGRGDLIDAVNRLLSSAEDWAACSARARRYFLAHHAISKTVDAYEQLLDGLFQQ